MTWVLWLSDCELCVESMNSLENLQCISRLQNKILSFNRPADIRSKEVHGEGWGGNKKTLRGGDKLFIPVFSVEQL